jgi:beta-lactamase superfamily II metal-dependent hydrolase
MMAANMKLPASALCVLRLAGGLGLKAAGPSRTANRVLAFMNQDGVKKVDYLVFSHLEDDHMRAAAANRRRISRSA